MVTDTYRYHVVVHEPTTPVEFDLEFLGEPPWYPEILAAAQEKFGKPIEPGHRLVVIKI